MAFNRHMDKYHPDAAVIDRLGGSAEVARKLGYDPSAGGVQRVQNWKMRGIPELVRLKNPSIFAEPDAAPSDVEPQQKAA